MYGLARIHPVDKGWRKRKAPPAVLERDPERDVHDHRPRPRRFARAQAARPSDLRATLLRRNPDLLHRGREGKASDRRPLFPGSELPGILGKEIEAPAGHVRFL